jgi:hypothetical protein
MNPEKLELISHRFLNLKSVKNLKIVKQKSPSTWQLIIFGWPILNFKFGEKISKLRVLGPNIGNSRSRTVYQYPPNINSKNFDRNPPGVPAENVPKITVHNLKNLIKIEGA